MRFTVVIETAPSSLPHRTHVNTLAASPAGCEAGANHSETGELAAAEKEPAALRDCWLPCLKNFFFAAMVGAAKKGSVERERDRKHRTS